jgi:hypothetical protein
MPWQLHTRPGGPFLDQLLTSPAPTSPGSTPSAAAAAALTTTTDLAADAADRYRDVHDRHLAAGGYGPEPGIAMYCPTRCQPLVSRPRTVPSPRRKHGSPATRPAPQARGYDEREGDGTREGRTGRSAAIAAGRSRLAHGRDVTRPIKPPLAAPRRTSSAWGPTKAAPGTTLAPSAPPRGRIPARPRRPHGGDHELARPPGSSWR